MPRRTRSRSGPSSACVRRAWCRPASGSRSSTRRDAAYFAPLRQLDVPTDTELYFALVPYHPEEQEKGTTDEQVQMVEEHLGGNRAEPVEWGICTECGMARAERDEFRCCSTCTARSSRGTGDPPAFHEVCVRYRSERSARLSARALSADPCPVTMSP